MNKQFSIYLVVAAVIVSGAAVYSALNYQITDELAVSSDFVQNKIQTGQILVVDIRDSDSYRAGHIPGSASDALQGATLEKRIQTIQARIPQVPMITSIVLVDQDGAESREVTQQINDAGINAFYLQDGIDGWTGQVLQKNSNTLILPEQLYSQLQDNKDIFVLDVRQPEELEISMISGSINVPLESLFETDLSEIPTDKPVVVVCGSGNRATIATYELAQYGIDFQVLDGGIKAWDEYLQKNQLPQA